MNVSFFKFIQNFFLILILFVLTLIVTPHSSFAQKKSPNVNQMFQTGKKLFDAEQYGAATQVFIRLLKKYPKHEASILLYGRSLYRLGKIKESYALYARLNPQFLDPESSYEFGQAFLANQQFAGALYAFKRVPPDHSLSDLASFYGAICALKIRNYNEAEELFDKAVVLPEKLTQSKEAYLKHLSQMKKLQLQAEFSKEQELEKKRLLEEQKRMGVPSPPDDNSNSIKQESQSLQDPIGHFTIDRIAGLSYQNKSQQIDFSGYKNQDYTHSLFSFDFKNGLQTKFASAHKMGLQLQLKAEYLKSTGSETRLFTESDDATVTRTLSQSLPKSVTKNGGYQIKPWYEFWINSQNIIGTSVFFQQRYPEFLREGMVSSFGSDSVYIFRLKEQEIKARYELEHQSNAKNKNLLTSNKVSAVYLYTFPTNTSLEPRLEHRFFVYHDPLIEGADSISLVGLHVFQLFPLNIKTGIKGNYFYQHNYLTTRSADFDEISANANSFFGEFYVESDWTWFKLGAKANLEQSYWKLKDEASKIAFENVVPNRSSQYIIDASINLLF